MCKHGVYTYRVRDLPIGEQAYNHYTLVKQQHDFYTGLYCITNMLQSCLAIMYGQLY